MKRPKTKKEISITVDNDVHKFLEENFENKSQYIEYLIYKDIKENNLLVKEIIL